jgi:transcriptional regulator with XRE-family HTH domain
VSDTDEQGKLLIDFGANVRRERTARRITQEKLAELADLNIRTVQKIESGELNVLITTLIRIKRGLGCRWDRLVPPE